MTPSLLVIIGQIASGKTTVARLVAASTNATVSAIDEIREAGGDLAFPSLAKHLTDRDRPTVFECSGTRDDFELLMSHLESIGARPFVVKLTCSLETAARRLRTASVWRPPRYGTTWEGELRWVATHLRRVPADQTIATDDLPPDAVAAAVLSRWQAHQAAGPVDAGGLSGTFSFSKLAAFERCPLAYRFRFIDARQSSYESVPAFLGRMVHASLSWMYGQRQHGISPSWAQVREHVHSVTSLLIATDTVMHERILQAGEPMLRYHYDNVFMSDRMTTLAVEQRFELDLVPGVSFRGVVDRVATASSGLPVVIDYKTSAHHEPEPASVPDLLQLDTYAIAAMLWTLGDLVSVRRHHVATGTEERHDVPRHDIDRIRAALRRWIRTVTRQSAYEPRPSRDCRWCPYNPICPMPLFPLEPGAQVDGETSSHFKLN